MPPPPPARLATKGRAPSKRSPPPPIPLRVVAGSLLLPAPSRCWLCLLTRVPQSRRLGSRAAGCAEDTRALGRGGGGVALPLRTGRGSRLCLRPRTGAAASSSFRLPLAPSLGRPVLRGKQRLLRVPPHAPQGPTSLESWERAASGALAGPQRVSLPAPRAERHKRQFCSFPGS